jgi:hypothetical protein
LHHSADLLPTSTISRPNFNAEILTEEINRFAPSLTSNSATASYVRPPQYRSKSFLTIIHYNSLFLITLSFDNNNNNNNNNNNMVEGGTCVEGV